LQAIAVGARDEELFTTIANRLTRLDKQISEKEKKHFADKANGKTVSQVVKDLLNAYNPDVIEDLTANIENEMRGESPNAIKSEIQNQHSAILDAAARVFTGDLNDYIENVRKAHEQRIDHANPDEIINVGWGKDNKDKAAQLVKDFTGWMQQHKDELMALQIFYNQPFRRRELTYTMIKEVLEKLQNDKPTLAPMHIWHAYEALGASTGSAANGSPLKELTALVSLIRKVSGLDTTLMAYDKTVDKNFQDWVFKKQAGATKFNEEQMQWLRMIKEYVTNSFHIEKEDFDLNPFNAQGGLSKMWKLFGEETELIINELNEALAA